LNENRRLHYLEAIGIDTYVPRRLLVNAPEASLCELAIVETEAPGMELVSGASGSVSDPALSEGSVFKQEDNIGRPLNKTISSVLEGFSDAPVRKPVLAEVEAASETNSAASAGQLDKATVKPEEKARFQLGLWLTDTSIQVVDARQPGDALPTQVLLTNFLIACGLIQTNLSPMESQVWPLAGAPESEQGWEAACSMMEDFLQFRFEAKSTRALILCGQDAVKAALGPDAQYEAMLFKQERSAHYDVELVVLPALREFLYKPELKASVWKALTSLRDALA